MKVMTTSEVRRNFAAVVDAVVDDTKAVVIVSLDEWNSMRETVYLLRSPANARRLLDSIAQAEEGLVEEHAFIDPDAV